MKKLTITISSRDYDISLEDDFAEFFQNDLSRYLNQHNAIDPKDLLTAYVQKCYECYEQRSSIDKVALKISEII